MHLYVQFLLSRLSQQSSPGLLAGALWLLLLLVSMICDKQGILLHPPALVDIACETPSL